MDKITVKSIKHDEGENKPFIITTTKGAKMSGFDASLGNLKPGAVIEVEVKTDGKFTNIKKWQMVSEPTPTKVNELFSSPLYHVSSLMKIACLQEVGHYIRGADMREDTQHSSLMPKGTNAPYQAIVDKYWQIIDQNLDSLLLGETKAALPGTKDPAGETKPATGEIPTFKASHELVNYYLKLDCPIDKIKEVLGIKNPTEITDVKAAAEKLYAYWHSIK